MVKHFKTFRRSFSSLIILIKIFASIFWWCAFILLAAPRDRYKKYVRELAYRLVRQLLVISRVPIDVKLETALSLTNGPYIFMANHQSYFDIPLLASVFWPFSISWVAVSWLVHVPLFGWAFRQLDPILVKPGDKARNRMAMRAAREKLAKGNSLLVFPEGGRSHDGGLTPFKKGFFYLALESEVPIVPVTIIGIRQVFPPRTWEITAGKVTIFVGNPLVPNGFSVNNLRETVRERIASYLDLENSECWQPGSTAEERLDGQERVNQRLGQMTRV